MTTHRRESLLDTMSSRFYLIDWAWNTITNSILLTLES